MHIPDRTLELMAAAAETQAADDRPSQHPGPPEFSASDEPSLADFAFLEQLPPATVSPTRRPQFSILALLALMLASGVFWAVLRKCLPDGSDGPVHSIWQTIMGDGIDRCPYCGMG